jgi:hypothetical protein
MSTHNTPDTPLREDLRGRPILPDESAANLDPSPANPARIRLAPVSALAVVLWPVLRSARSVAP